MQERSSIGSPRSANSFYFMFFATSIFLKDSKELELSPDPHPKLKFLIYKGPQMFNNTREVIRPNLTSGWSKLEKVQMCFFLKDFQSNRKVEFMGLLYDIGQDQQQFLGDIVLSTHKYVEAYRQGAELVHEQGQFGPYVVNYVILIEKDRHRLEKLLKKYKESKEYLELQEVTEINVGSLAEPANSQKIIESAKGIQNNDFRLGVEQDESQEGSPVGKMTSALQQTPNFVDETEQRLIKNQEQESQKIEKRNNDEEIQLTTKIEEPQQTKEVEHEANQTIQKIEKGQSNQRGHEEVQQTQNMQHSKQQIYQPITKHQEKPLKGQQLKQVSSPNVESNTKQNITTKQQSGTAIKGNNINKTEKKQVQTIKTQSKPAQPIKKQLNSEKKIVQTQNLESINSNKSIEVQNHDEPVQFKITFRVLIFLLISGILIYHFLNPIEPSLKPKKLRKPKKSSQTAENIPIQNRQKVQQKKSK